MKTIKIDLNLISAILPSAVYELDDFEYNSVILTYADFIALNMVLNNLLGAKGYKLNARAQRLLNYYKSNLELFAEDLAEHYLLYNKRFNEASEEIQEIVTETKELIKGYVHSSLYNYTRFPKIKVKDQKKYLEIGKRLYILKKLLILSTIDHHGNCQNCDNLNTCNHVDEEKRCNLWINNSMIGYVYTKSFKERVMDT